MQVPRRIVHNNNAREREEKKKGERNIYNSYKIKGKKQTEGSWGLIGRADSKGEGWGGMGEWV